MVLFDDDAELIGGTACSDDQDVFAWIEQAGAAFGGAADDEFVDDAAEVAAAVADARAIGGENDVAVVARDVVGGFIEEPEIVEIERLLLAGLGRPSQPERKVGDAEAFLGEALGGFAV